MIENYLDFVKRWRKFYLCEGISSGRKRRNRVSSYLKGFESGYALAAMGAARQFKRLQKDIEKRNDGDPTIAGSSLYDLKSGDILS